MLFVLKFFSTKGTKMHILWRHRGILRHFHIVSRRFRAVFGSFSRHSVSCCFEWWHITQQQHLYFFLSFTWNWYQFNKYIWIFNLYNQFCLPLKFFICIPFFNHFFSHFMVNSSNIFKKKVGGQIFVLKIF